jgi:diguanylate cyclase (GGDEF)-like protein
MVDSQNSLQKRLDSLRRTYLDKLPDKVREAEEAWSRVAETTWNAETFLNLHRVIHTLAGSCAVFGLKSLSNTARELERLLKATIDGESYAPEELKANIRRCLVELKRVSPQSPEEEMALPAMGPVSPSPSAVPEERERKLIFLIEDDPFQLESLTIQVSHFGYTVRSFSNLEEARAAVRQTLPSAIVMDVVFPESDLAGIETILAIRNEQGAALPVIFISKRNDLDARLQAARAGGDAYFIKPVNIITLIEKLDMLTTPRESSPYRILIVDDEPELASYYASILQEAGMHTAIVNDPLQVLDPLIEFNPDLILTDMYMPSCTGQELAKVIRQMEAYVSIPIVFLSTETNVEKQLTAMRVGGDDFLTKPIQPDHLISSVLNRSERMRIMRAFMERDGLTGLLNHTKIREHLDLAVEKARRQNSDLAFAMIDIDRFKSVNDTYGHSTGDRVLNGLARLLQQRLRKTDIVGRYGGEEFAVVLLDTDIEFAGRVLDNIRISFSEITHSCEDKRFNVTFSCGLAPFPHYPDVISLSNAADKALYISKAEGRNRITVLRD